MPQLKELASILLTVYFVFLISRCYEWALIGYYHGTQLIEASYIGPALLYDFGIALVWALGLWILFEAFKNIAANFAIPITAALIALVGLSNILLISYFSATLVPLGPEFWAYSFSEMSETVIASNHLTVWSSLFVILFGILLYLGSYKLIDRGISDVSRLIYPGIAIACIAIAGITGSLVISGQTPYSFTSNKLTYFVNQSIQNSTVFGDSSPSFDYKNQEYPFLHKADHKNVLDAYFQEAESPPNIVFLMVESLGGEFVGDSGQWTGFAPFLDSLAQEGLYWKNGLSLSGRTFGLVPSLLGSLPPVKNGFMDWGPSYPNHQTLFSLLEKNGYHTSFFSGYDTYFDNLEYFLSFQGTDFVLNKQLIESKHLSSSQSGQNYWGVDDKTMFGTASGILDTLPSSPRLEIYHTLQSHSPFTVPRAERYSQKFNRRLQNLELSDARKEAYRRYESELTTLFYTDDAIQQFMESYRQRDEYQRTIFVITGDHWLIPVPQTSEISRYHVPIIIYSPLLKKNKQFNAVNTHANIVPTLTSYLNQFSSISMPDSVHWISSELDTTQNFRNVQSTPLMKNKNQLTDYLHNGYYLGNNRLYKLTDNLELRPTKNDSISQKLSNKLNQFKAKSQYAVAQNKLFPASGPGLQSPRQYDFMVRYDSVFQKMKEQNFTIDQQFEQARQYAFDGRFEVARAIARRILLQYPNYHDVRILMGRTHAWEGNYEQARTIFQNVLERDPSYYDTYNALFDTEFWAGNYNKALHVINDGLAYHPTHKQLLEKKVRILVTLNRQNEAGKIFETYKTEYPQGEALPRLKQLLSN